MDKNLLEELKAFLKTDQIIADKSSIQVYQRDGLSGYSGTPGMVLLPESENDIVKIVKICSKYSIPVVTRGPVQDCLAERAHQRLDSFVYI